MEGSYQDHETPLVVIGAGGHSKVVIEALRASGRMPLYATDANPERWGHDIVGLTVAGGDELLEDHKPDTILLVNGIGLAQAPAKRVHVFNTLSSRGYRFLTFSHPSATIALDAAIEAGGQVMAGAVVQPGLMAGLNVIINTGAQVDHDCALGNHVHIAPGAVLGGGVRVNDRAQVGISATVLPGLTIGSEAIVGAGAVVIDDVAVGQRVVGVPARPL